MSQFHILPGGTVALVATGATRLGAGRFAAATARGSAMSDDEAVAFAMAVVDRLSRTQKHVIPAPPARPIFLDDRGHP